MTDVGHYRRLERAYASAPVTQWYGAVIRIDDGTAEVRLPIRPEFHHAAGAVHGSVYFRILDDAGFFAANSVVTDVLVLTVSYTIHFLRPVQAGELRATGRLVHAGGQLLVAESQLFDAADRLLGQRGTGNREQGTGNGEQGTGIEAHLCGAMSATLGLSGDGPRFCRMCRIDRRRVHILGAAEAQIGPSAIVPP
jgi:uncharacterized protein (TIGR00369 family)